MGYLDNNYREVQEDQFREKLSRVVGYFQDLKKDIEHVILISHSDADGYACSAIMKYMLDREGISYSSRYYNRKGTWKQYLDTIIPQYDHIESLAVFFSDIGSEVNEIGRYFTDENTNVWILDHHEMNPVNEDKLPQNFHFLNPTVYGYDGLKEIAGASLVYLFAKEISLKNIKTAWIALIGITNDTLMNVKKYRSFNRMIVEEARNEGQINLCDGLMVYGATHENMKNGLAYSLFPFVKEIGGDPKKAKEILLKLQIPPTKKIIDLEKTEIDAIDAYFPEDMNGQFIEFPQKKGILRYAFEHGLIISQTAFSSPHQADRLIGSNSTPANSKEIYQNYIRNLTRNLNLFVTTPKEFTENVIFVDASRRISPNFWSDVASYASVNHLYHPSKILMLGGPDGNIIKLSVRCNENFPPLKQGRGVDYLINKFKKVYGGMGGGHKLAGGYKIAPNRYNKLKKEIDKYFPL